MTKTASNKGAWFPSIDPSWTNVIYEVYSLERVKDNWIKVKRTHGNGQSIVITTGRLPNLYDDSKIAYSRDGELYKACFSKNEALKRANWDVERAPFCCWKRSGSDRIFLGRCYWCLFDKIVINIWTYFYNNVINE